MILDHELLFCDAQEIAASAGSEASTNVVDLGAGTGRNMNPRLRVFCQVVQAPASEAALTLQVKLQGSANNSDWVDIVSSGAIGKADLPAGAQMLKDVPYLVDEKYRYYRLYFTQVQNATTRAKVTGGLIADGVPAIELTH